MRVHNTNLLQVQLTEAEKRHIKTPAASQGLTLRQATLQAFQAWSLQLQAGERPADPARGTRAGGNLQMPGQPKRAAVPKQSRRQTVEALFSTSGGGQVPKLEVPSRDWLHKAAQVDWSKCPAAQRVAGKAGNIWVVRGTRAPLDEVLESVAEGHPFLEIAKVFEITLQQLIAVLQFAAEKTLPASPGR